jgi:hypothetical protein
MLKETGETETMQENIQEWLELDEDHEFQVHVFFIVIK